MISVINTSELTGLLGDLASRSSTSRAHSLGVFPDLDDALSSNVSSSRVSFVLRFCERRSRPRNLSAARSGIVWMLGIGDLQSSKNLVSVQIPGYANIACFQWYLPRYQSIWAVPF